MILFKVAWCKEITEHDDEHWHIIGYACPTGGKYEILIRSRDPLKWIFALESKPLPADNFILIFC